MRVLLIVNKLNKVVFVQTKMLVVLVEMHQSNHSVCSLCFFALILDLLLKSENKQTNICIVENAFWASEHHIIILNF